MTGGRSCRRRSAERLFDEQRQLEEADIDRNQVTAQPLDVPAPIMAEDLSGVPIGALASLVASWRRAPA